MFPSTAIDPNQPVEPEVARNGNIYNIWTLNLKTKELRQFTDTLTGNTSPVVLRDTKPARIGFVTYYKGEYGIHVLAREEPLHTVASSDFGDAALGPPIPFQPPMTHDIVPANKRKKGAFEKLFLEGRPPVALGVTSGGDLFGGTQVTFTDVLGDKQFNIFAASVSQYRTLSFSYINLSRRLQYAMQAYSQTQFFYAYDPYAFYGIDYGYIDRDQAIATQTARGATISGIYPLNRYTRLEMNGGFLQFGQEYNEPGLQDIADEYQMDQYGRVLFVDGQFMPFGVNLVRETTIFREYGPLAGHTLSLGYEFAPSWGSLLSRQTLDGDARYYHAARHQRRAGAPRPRLQELGRVPGLPLLRRQLRDARLRLPVVPRQQGVLHRRRAPVPDHRSGADAHRRRRRPARRLLLQLRRRGLRRRADRPCGPTRPTIETPLIDYAFDPTSPSQFVPVYGVPRAVSGFRLVDSRASYGVGLETFALGFPIHFDWSWRTLFNKDYEDVVFSYPAAVDGDVGPGAGSKWFRKVKFSVWIGYDF